MLTICASTLTVCSRPISSRGTRANANRFVAPVSFLARAILLRRLANQCMQLLGVSQFGLAIAPSQAALPRKTRPGGQIVLPLFGLTDLLSGGIVHSCIQSFE